MGWEGDSVHGGGTSRIPHEGGWAHLVEFSALHVQVLEGPDQKLSVELPHTLLRIGSDPSNDLILTDPSVSRFHATVSWNREGILVTDLRSTNGTFVDRVRLHEGYVQPGDPVRVGSTTLRVEVRESRKLAIPMEKGSHGSLIGESPALREIYALIRTVARSPVTVLLEGETGTGKEVVAREIHEASGRKGEFVAVDCASVQKDLLQSELFGHKGGAFTGATEGRVGACRAADKGTLFIDEIGELPLSLQASFLRLLERREVKPLGTDRPLPVDIRVISATHVDLPGAVRNKEFREDLYHRLKIIRLRLPPLRERAGDVPLLIDHFSSQLGARLTFDPAARVRLEQYAWPGNVRELRHMVERLSVICAGRPVRESDLDLESPSEDTEDRPRGALTAEALREALERAGGNKSLAARTLGISRSTLFRKMRELGMDSDDPADA